MPILWHWPRGEKSPVSNFLGFRHGGNYLVRVEEFANLMLRASKALGAPSHLARHLGLQPSEVYRWIAGVERPARPRLGYFQARLIELLEGSRHASMRGRRWSDRN